MLSLHDGWNFILTKISIRSRSWRHDSISGGLRAVTIPYIISKHEKMMISGSVVGTGTTSLEWRGRTSTHRRMRPPMLTLPPYRRHIISVCYLASSTGSPNESSSFQMDELPPSYSAIDAAFLMMYSTEPRVYLRASHAAAQCVSSSNSISSWSKLSPRTSIRVSGIPSCLAHSEYHPAVTS